MPFEGSENIINISEIQNKTVQTRLYDTVYFKNYNALTGTDKENAMNEIKQHIQNYGAVFASIHGDSSDSINLSCYDNDTGAKYCNNSLTHKADHAISIIGWDDDYEISNFAEEARPSEKGAWIVRNSWGDTVYYDVLPYKEQVFNTYTNQCIAMGWNSAAEIPDSFMAQALGYSVEDGKIIVNVGDNGFMYVSYEDCNIGSTVYGITKAKDEVDYDYIYQYDELYPAMEIALNTPETIIFNTFEKQSTEKEYLTGVSLTTPETYTCRVYVNPNGDGKSKSDLQLVQLEAGESETIGRGYHTLEFAMPIEIIGDTFSIAVEVKGTRENVVDVLLEGKIDGVTLLDYAETEEEKCFVSTSSDLDTCTWFDLGDLEQLSGGELGDGDSSLKAFTTLTVSDIELDHIEIVTPPTKTEYTEGDNFDKTGMKIAAIFNDESKLFLDESDYTITDGTNLKAGQEYVTINYMDKSQKQKITVTAKSKPEPESKPKPESVEPPVSTDFSEAECKVNSLKAFYNDNNTSGYTLMGVEITGIFREMTNDSLEYYYYLSNKSNESNISGWTKISEKQTNSGKLSFTIDTRDISNLSEIKDADTLYIYIKEVVTRGGNQNSTISKGIKLEADASVSKIELYVDGGKVGDYDAPNTVNQAEETPQQPTPTPSSSNGGSSSTSSTLGQTNQPQASTTSSSATSASKLPYTGSSLIVIGIVILIICGLIVFVKYEILNKYVK